MLNRLFVFLLIVFGFVSYSEAQINYYSLLSKQGLGNIQNGGLLNLQSSGYLGATYSSPYSPNPLNPASYAKVSMTAFDFGMDYGVTNIDFSDQEKKFRNAGLQYVSLAFPLINPINKILDKTDQKFKLGFNLGLTPYSRVGYRSDVIDSVSTSGGYVSRYVKQTEGKGGTYKFHAGLGASYNDLSVGLNFSYLYGKIFNEQAIIAQSGYSFNDHLINIENYKGFTMQLGAMYDFYLHRDRDDPRNNKFLTLGVVGGFRDKVRVSADQEYFKKGYGFVGLDNIESPSIVSDTIYMRNVTNNVYLPSSIQLGLMYQHLGKLKAGLNFEYTGWKQYENPIRPEQLENAFTVSGGMEWVPNESSYTNAFERFRYRAGAYFGTDSRMQGGSQVKNHGVEIGVGMPLLLTRQISFVNLGLAYGKIVGGSISESTLSVKVGVTFNDNSWFYKRRFE